MSGTISSGEQVSIFLQKFLVGDTDSERAFCFLLQELRRNFRRRAAPHWKHVAPLLAELAGGVARFGNFNFLLSDGEVLYAHASTRLHALQRQHPFAEAHLVDHDLVLDLAQANGPDDRMVLIATEPLTRNEPWRPFAAGELRVFEAGEEVWRHTPARREAPAAHFAARLVAA